MFNFAFLLKEAMLSSMTYGELELRPLTLIKFNYDGPDLSTSGDAAAPRLTFLDGPR
jgi:hypothetical protein